MGFINPGRNLHSRIPGKRKPKHPTAATTSSSSSSTTSTTSSTARKRQRTRPPLSPLESLPAELLYRIFESSHNLSLPAASLHLTHTLNTPHLHLLHLRTHLHSPTALSEIFRLRFFTAPLLHLFESRFGALDAAGAALPIRLVTAPWTDEGLSLFAALVERGADVGGVPGEREEFTWVLLRALQAGREDVARVVMAARGRGWEA
ncbi:hypothetical protein P167DRAFT_563497 [Morchella conica CCBAS932]|uniref:Uncharacterized protein n=1 Tax=Morchella conica CCBAS932 TaxID=1392247 RepID=A0A3N4KW43_9PEZI|nr:hypothetical protein P167DRAFT_563497 [Morchella conica CCBAS932]